MVGLGPGVGLVVGPGVGLTVGLGVGLVVGRGVGVGSGSTTRSASTTRVAAKNRDHHTGETFTTSLRLGACTICPSPT